MSIAFKSFRLTAYGQAFSKLGAAGRRKELPRVAKSSHLRRPVNSLRDTGEYLLVSSGELNEAFKEHFHQHATLATRLLVLLDKEVSPDTLLSRILDLKIRSSQRFYLMDVRSGPGNTDPGAFILELLKRLSSAVEAQHDQDRIFDARIEKDGLIVVAPDFTRLDVPIAGIPQLKHADHSQIQKFEIDEDGAFIYWPNLDLHLGWAQLQQIAHPDAARKALQKSREFNVRYGTAVQKVRQAAGLKPSDIPGLSAKQLGRIEQGECRLTSNAIETLSKAHGLKANQYLQKLAETLVT